MERFKVENRFVQFSNIQLPDWCSWMGAISFGVRSAGSVRVLTAASINTRRATLISYLARGNVDPHTASKRELNRARIRELLEGTKCEAIDEVQFSSYAATPLTTLMKQMCQEARANDGRSILDVTALTKFHTVIAAAEAAAQRLEGSLTLAYTIPENYIGFDKRERYSAGFGETLILPLVDGAKLRHEERARGVILPGHEGQRLLVALGEIEPIGGTIIHSVTPSRPDFEQVARHRNMAVYADLRRSGTWRDASVNFRRVRSVSLQVRAEIGRAKRDGAPLLLYPFGPKPAIFAAAFTAARLYPEGSWFVYPIPSQSSTQHTEGISNTYWMNL